MENMNEVTLAGVALIVFVFDFIICGYIGSKIDQFKGVERGVGFVISILLLIGLELIILGIII